MTHDLYVKGLSAKEIEGRALAWRDALGVGGQWSPDMIEVLEHRVPTLLKNLCWQYMMMKSMGDAEAYTQFTPPRIVLRESVYRAAAEYAPRSRMTLAHELGHLVLHSGLAKARGPAKIITDQIKPFNSAEWQANKFAATFLMPEHLVRQFGSAEDLADGCRVSLRSANIRMREVNHLGKKPIPDDVKLLIRELRDNHPPDNGGWGKR